MQEQKTRLIIVPGSCSSRTNWFDQFEFFEGQGYQVEYCELEAEDYQNFGDAVRNLERKFEGLVEPGTVIVAHSMGAMMVMNLMLGSRSQKLAESLAKSHLYFIQMPVRTKDSTMKMLELSQYVLPSIMFVYSFLLGYLFDSAIYVLKQVEYKLPRLPIVSAVINFVLNFASVINSVFNTKPLEYINLVNYYRDYDANTWIDAIPGLEQSEAFGKIDLNISHGEPDIFCTDAETIKFAQRIGARTKQFNLNCHNPHHYTWNQKAVHEWICKQQASKKFDPRDFLARFSNSFTKKLKV